MPLSPPFLAPKRKDLPTAEAYAMAMTTIAPVRELKGQRLRLLRELERKVLSLRSAWTVHNANHLREHPDGLKVGGHQASSASIVTLMTALYMQVLRPEDRVAVKPHGSPVLHAIQYLFGHQPLDQLQRFRMLGGAQSYPSRTKDQPTLDLDYSTGSVGLGVAITLFGAAGPGLRAAQGPGARGRQTGPPGRAGRRRRARRGQRLRGHARRLEARRAQRLVGDRLQPPEPRLAWSPTGCSRASRACSRRSAGGS